MADDRILIEIDANDQASEKIRAVSRALNDLDKDTSNLNSSTGIDSFDKKIDKFYRNALKVNNAARSFQAAISGITNTTKRLLQDAGAAIWDFTSDSIRAFDEFSEAHAKMLGVIGASPDYYDKNGNFIQQKYQDDAQALKQQAITIGSYGTDGRGSLENPTDVAEIQLALSRAGISAETMLDPNSNIMDSLIKFAKGNDVDMENAVQFAVSLGNQFGYKPEQWGEMLDKVAHTSDLAPINVNDIVESMKYAGGISSGIGRDMEETLGMIATLGNFGLRGSQAGSGIQALLTRLLTQDTTVITDAQAEVAPPKALQAFYDFSKYAKSDGLAGVNYKDFKNIVANGGTYKDLGKLSGNLRPMDEVIDQLDDAMSDLNDEEQAWFAKKFFGLYQMKAAYGLMSGEEQDLNEIITDIKEQSSGSNERKYSEIIDSSYGKEEALKSAIEGTKIDFGDRLSPFTNKVRDELISFLNDPANYEIDFDGLHDALDEACNLIEEKYGSAVAKAVQDLGDFTLDFVEVTKEIAPEFMSGIGGVFSDLLNGDVLGAMGDWGSMMDSMKSAVNGLPEELQDLGGAVIGVIDWMGKLMALDIAAKFAELFSSLAMVGAMTVKAGTVVVNGLTTSGNSGSNTVVPNAGTAGLTGKTVIGNADDVARALGMSTDDVISGFGEAATYSIDDIAKGFGISVDDVISGFGTSIDDVVKNSSKVVGGLSKAGKALGVAGIALQVGMSGYEAYNAFSNDDGKGGWNAIASGGGSLAGGAAGAAIGSAIFPGAGTIIGGIIGSLAGGAAGGAVSDSIYNASDYTEQYNDIMNQLTETSKEQQQELSKLRTQYDGLTSKYGASSTEALRLKYQIDQLESQYGSGGETLNDFNSRVEASNTKQQVLKSALGETSTSIENGANSVKALIQRLEDLSNDNSGDHVAEIQTLIDALNESIGGLNLSIEDVQGNTENALKSTKELLDAQVQAELEQAEQETYKQLVKDSPQLEEDYNTAQANYDAAVKRRSKARNAFKKEYGYDVSQVGVNGADAFFGHGIPGVQGYYSDEKKEYDASVEALNTATEALNNAKDAWQSNQDQIAELTNKFDQKDNAKSLSGQITEQINKGLANSFTVEKAGMIGELNIPNIASEIASKYPGWNALSDKGKDQVIQDAIDNNITIDDSVTMTPSFNVSAPNVNVNVKVDQAGNVTKNIITTPGTGSLLDSFISKTSSQYGQSNNASHRVNRGQR